MATGDEIVRIIRDVSPSTTVRADQYGESLLDLGLDSLDHATVLLQVEEKFGVKIPDELGTDLVTVTAIAELVTAQRGGRA